MDLLADLRHYPAVDALQWAGAARFDGQLLFQRNRHAVTMALIDGRIVSCDSNRPFEAFRRHLYSQGWVDRPDLEEADRHAKPGGLGQALLALKRLTRGQLREASTEHTTDLTCSVVSWPDGVVSATASRRQPLSQAESEPLDALFATMEASRRVDDMARIRETVPHDNVRLGVGEVENTSVTFTAPQRRLLEDFDGSQTAGELHRAIGGCKYSFLRNLADLLDLGALTCLEVGPAPEPPEENRLSLVDVLFDDDLDLHLRGANQALGRGA